MCSSSAWRAPSSITGPTSVAGIGRVADDQRVHGARRGPRSGPSAVSLGTIQQRAAPSSAGRPSRRPRAITSSITCSRSAVVSTNMPFRPPVSAMKGTIGPLRAASVWLMRQAVSVPPVKATPSTARDGRSAPTDLSPSPGHQRQQARVEAGGVETAAPLRRRSAGSVRPAWPAPRCRPPARAAIWPVKMASGKFHGLMQTKTPRPCSSSRLVSPTGPVSGLGPGELALGEVRRSSGRNPPPRAPRATPSARVLPAFARQDGDQPFAVGFQRVGHGAQHLGARGAADASQARSGPRDRVASPLRRRLRWWRDLADHARTIDGTGHVVQARTGLQLAADDWAGGQRFGVELRDGRVEAARDRPVR